MQTAPPLSPVVGRRPAVEPAIRRLAWGDLQAALRQGWADFLALPSQLGFLGLIYPIVGLVAARAVLHGGLLDLLYPLLAGLSLLGPVLATGVYELSRRRERGLPTHPIDAFKVVHDPAMPGVALIGVMLLGIAALWILAARAIFALMFGAEPSGLMALLQAVFDTPQGWGLLLLGNFVGLLFAVLTLALTVVSVPMVLDRNVSPLAGLRTSLRVVGANPAMVAAWGLIVAALLVLGSIPLFVGLAVVMPLLGHATWHLYRRAVV